MENFKDLNLDTTKIENIVKQLKDCTIKSTNTTDKTTTFKIDKNGISCILIIHYNTKNKGTTTLQIQGKGIELGQEICQKIKKETLICELPDINQSIIITDEHFEELIKLVKENFNDHITEKEISGGTSYIFQKSKEGKFTFNFYKKSRKLLLQGKTLHFFSFIVNILTNQDYDILHEILSGSKVVELEKSVKLLNEHLPTLAPKLPLQVKNVVTPSLQLIKVNMNFPDYSIILFPALKTMEHVIINVLEENDIDYNSKIGFNMFSLWSPTNSYKLDTKFTQLKDITKSKLEKCYTFYHKQRHGLFHLGADLTEIRTIETREIALELLFECIDLMEDISDDFPA